MSDILVSYIVFFYYATNSWNFVLNFTIFALRTAVVAEPLVSGIFLSTSLIFVLRTVVVLSH